MNAFALRLLITTLDKITDRLVVIARRSKIEGAGACRHGVPAWTVDGALHHETGKSTAMRRVLAPCDAGVVGDPSTEPTLAIRKLGYLFPIRDVESVRILQEFGWLPLERDAEELYAELTAPATTPAAPSRETAGNGAEPQE